jgi:hypothetical protein
MRLAAQVVFVLGLIGWEVFGHPKQDIANWFWSDGPAPWERVDAFCYPDKGRLTVSLDNMTWVGSPNVEPGLGQLPRHKMIGVWSAATTNAASDTSTPTARLTSIALRYAEAWDL